MDVLEEIQADKIKIETAEQYSDILAKELLEKPDVYSAIRDYHNEQIQKVQQATEKENEYTREIENLKATLLREQEAKEKAMNLAYETLKKIPIDTITQKQEQQPFNVERVVNDTLSKLEQNVNQDWKY